MKQYLKTILWGTRQEGKRSTDILRKVALVGWSLSIGLMVVMGPLDSRVYDWNMDLSIPFLRLLVLVTVMEDFLFKLVPYGIIYLLTSRKNPDFKQNLYVRTLFILPIISIGVHLTNLYSMSWGVIPYCGVHFFVAVIFTHFLVKYGFAVCWGVHYLYDVLLIAITVICGGLR